MTKLRAWSRRALDSPAPMLVLRGLRDAVIALVAVWVLYLVVIQTLLWTPLLSHLVNQSRESVLVTYESAWSIWPAKVHVRGLQIRIHDRVADVVITADTLVASFDLPVLLAKQLTVHEVRASGMSVRIRPRYPTGEIRDDELEGQPEIPGFPDPRRSPRPPRLDSDDNYSSFTVDLRHVVAENVREIWIGPFRFSGRSRVEGNMYLRPSRKLQVGPARVDVESGDLYLAKRPFAQGVKGSVECTIPMTPMRNLSDSELIRSFVVGLDLESDIDDFAFLQRWLVHDGELSFAAGPGHAKSRVKITHGTIEDGSNLFLSSKRLELHHPRMHAVSDLEVQVAVDKGEAKGSATLSRTKLMHRWAQNWPIEAETIGFAAHSKSLDLSRSPFDDVVVSADAPAIKFTDMRLLRLFQTAIMVNKSVATLKAHVDFDTHANLVAADGALSAPQFQGTVEGVGIGGNLVASAKMPRLDLFTMKGSIPSFRVEVSDVQVRAVGGKKPPPPWWGRLEARDVIFDRDHIITDISAKLRDARPIMYLLAAKDELPEWTRGLVEMEGLLASAHFETGPGRIELDRLDAKAGPWKVGGHVKQIGLKREGELYVGNGTLGLKIPLDSNGASPKPAVGGGPQESQ